jgi:hypothetical protein
LGNSLLARINIGEFSLSKAFVFHIICRAVERKRGHYEVVSFRRFFGGCGLLGGRFIETVMNAVNSLNMVSISREPDQKVIACWAPCSGIMHQG